MMQIFDGKHIREEILSDLSNKIAQLEIKPVLAEFLIGDDPISRSYVELKKKMAERVGIIFCLYSFEKNSEEKEIIDSINFLNNDLETKGIFIQIPLPEGFDRNKIISAISPKKDVDGLRYCLGLESDYKPPVVEAILEALRAAGIMNHESGIKKKITLIGRGFLVGKPLERALREKNADLTVLDSDAWEDKKIHDSLFQIHHSDCVISATGNAGIIKPEMVKEGVVLIDAGTAEENGELRGDVDPDAYTKASYYTPVPGGIGPVTIAMLFKNLIK